MSEDVRNLIHIHMITSTIEHSPQRGWVHTHGMAALELPELEIRGVPLILMYDAASLLNHVAQYMLDGKRGLHGARPVKLHEKMGVGHSRIVYFDKLPPVVGDEDHFKDERWALTDAAMGTACSCGRCSAN